MHKFCPDLWIKHMYALSYFQNLFFHKFANDVSLGSSEAYEATKRHVHGSICLWLLFTTTLYDRQTVHVSNRLLCNSSFIQLEMPCKPGLLYSLAVVHVDSLNRNFKQITTAGTDKAAGSTCPPK